MKFFLVFAFALALAVAVAVASEDTKEESDVCEPGQKYKVDCNTCECAASGKKSESFCTLMACPPVAEEKDTDSCEPGTTFSNDGCNTCTCPESGSKASAACTAIACAPASP